MVSGVNGRLVTALATRLRNGCVRKKRFEAFVDYRESLGFRVSALTGGEQPPYEQLKKALEAGEVVCLLSERDLTRSGVEVDFFGEPCSMAAGPATLAQRNRR